MTASQFGQTRRQFLTTCGVMTGATVAATTVGSVSANERLAMKIADLHSDHVLTPAIRLATESVAAAEKLSGYSANFVKSEVVNGKMLKGRMELKIRHQPFSVYMKFVTPKAGRELIYVDGGYGGNLQVHETGLASLVGTLSLDPRGNLAMGESRYPVSMLGIRTMAETIVDQWVMESVRTTPKVQYYPNASLGNVACRAIESTHSAPTAGVKFQRTRLYIASESGLPMRVQQYEFNRQGGEPILVEDYTYVDIQPTVQLSNLDFDVANPSYNF